MNRATDLHRLAQMQLSQQSTDASAGGGVSSIMRPPQPLSIVTDDGKDAFRATSGAIPIAIGSTEAADLPDLSSSDEDGAAPVGGAFMLGSGHAVKLNKKGEPLTSRTPITISGSSSVTPQPLIACSALQADGANSGGSCSSTPAPTSGSAEAGTPGYVSGACDDQCSAVTFNLNNASLSYQLAMVVRLYIPSVVVTESGTSTTYGTTGVTETSFLVTLPRLTGYTQQISPSCCCPEKATPMRADVTYYKLKDDVQIIPEAFTDVSAWMSANSSTMLDVSGANPITGLLPMWRYGCNGGDGEQWVLPGSSARGLVLDAGRTETGGQLRRFSISVSASEYVKNRNVASVLVRFGNWPDPVVVTKCADTTPYILAIILLVIFAIVLMGMIIWYIVETDPYIFKKD